MIAIIVGFVVFVVLFFCGGDADHDDSCGGGCSGGSVVTMAVAVLFVTAVG